MNRLARTSPLLAVTCLLGCPPWPEFVTCEEVDACTTGTGSTTKESVPTDASEVQTLTSASDETTGTAPEPSTSTGPQEDAAPTIDAFEVVPEHLGEAGQAELHLVVSADVIKVRLSLDGVMLADDLGPDDFPRTWDALSAKDNGPAREFEVVVEDAGGLTATATDHLSVQLPQPGTEKCIFEDLDADVVTSSVALKYTPEAIFAVGARDTGDGLTLTAWKLDPDGCGPLPGWPRSVKNWSADDNFKKMLSIGAAVDLDEDGNLVVGGNFIVGGAPQSYVALLNAGGSLLWERAGAPGDEVTSVAAATGQYKDRVFVGGSRRTSDVPLRTDAAIWIYQASGQTAFVGPPDILAAPFTRDEPDDPKNERSEWVRALLIQPGTGNALAVGEREFRPTPNNTYSRAFTAQVHPLGGIVGTPWTSWAPAFLHDALRSVTRCGDQVLAGGWTRDVPLGAKPQPMIFWIEDDGSAVKHRDEPQLGSTQINGIACDREAKIVSAGTRDALARDAQVFTVPGQDGPRTMYETGVPGDDGAGAVACDWRGFCVWGGYHPAKGKPHAVVRVHHP